MAFPFGNVRLLLFRPVPLELRAVKEKLNPDEIFHRRDQIVEGHATQTASVGSTVAHAVTVTTEVRQFFAVVAIGTVHAVGGIVVDENPSIFL